MSSENELKNNRGKEKGFTLLELMVTMFLLPMLFLCVCLILNTANVVFHTNDIYSRLNTSAMQTLRFVSREIGQTSPNILPSHFNLTTDASNNSIVRFQIPVDWDNDGDADTGGQNPAIEWGVYDQAGQTQNGRLGGWVRYSVVNHQLLREVLDANQNAIAGLTRVVANNIQTFRITQNQNVVSMNLTLLGTDTIGQAGRSRDIQTSFATSTVLRNAVN